MFIIHDDTCSKSWSSISSSSYTGQLNLNANIYLLASKGEKRQDKADGSQDHDLVQKDDASLVYTTNS